MRHKWLRTKFVAIQESWNDVVTGWFVRLIGIRDDGATFVSYIALDGEDAQGVTFDNVKGKTIHDLTAALDGMLSKRFKGKIVPLNAFIDDQDWEEQ
jgi:hypothetical protein